MKKTNLYALTLAFATLVLFSCSDSGNKKDGTTNGTASETTAEQKSSNPGKMDDFMKMLDGTTQGAANAYNTYASDGLKQYNGNQPMAAFADFKLADPKIVAVTGLCCTMEAKSGMTTRTYKVCWLDDKISGIDFIGMK